MKKSAILFGINEYHDCPLQNAVNDATVLSEKLSQLGFDAECCLNVSRESMDRSLLAFRSKLEQSSVGLFFFAGHGIQCKGENFLATKDTNFVDEISCRHTSFPLNDVIDIFEESKVTTKIFILDACRNNPFVTWRSAANDGLAPVYAPKGTIIAFSTSPGQKASDGKNGHGVYTEALLEHISTKNLAIEDMFKRVRNTVSSHTSNRQITWEHTSLMGTFYFNSGIDEDEARPIYSENALADRDYDFESDGEIESIVHALKTYDWYKQNPAISKISQIDFSHADKDDLFVLGRNIYQTACGGSRNAQSWIADLEINLNSIGGSAAIHILNGILFEIYFNSSAQIRRTLKAEQYETPVKLCIKDRYAVCGLFIRDFLEQYPQRLIYIPGSRSVLTTDILISREDDEYHIDGICVDGLSCMYDEDATEFSQDSYQLYIATREQDLRNSSDNSWQSDTIYSDTPHATYQGSEKLKSRTRYYWQVIAWDRTKEHKIISPISSFETAQLNQSDWTGVWITDNHDKDYTPAPMLRKSFIAQDDIQQARLYVSAAAYYKMTLNGKSITSSHLNPGFTHYDKRNLYNTYDVTSQLLKGENVLSAILGNVFYNESAPVATWSYEQARWRNRPRMICEMEILYAEFNLQMQQNSD